MGLKERVTQESLPHPYLGTMLTHRTLTRHLTITHNLFWVNKSKGIIWITQWLIPKEVPWSILNSRDLSHPIWGGISGRRIHLWTFIRTGKGMNLAHIIQMEVEVDISWSKGNQHIPNQDPSRLEVAKDQVHLPLSLLISLQRNLVGDPNLQRNKQI